MQSPAWYLNRLRAMGRAEVAWRARSAIQARAERWGLGRARPPEPAGELPPSWLPVLAPEALADAQQLDMPAVVDAAERVLAGRFDVFALRGAELGFPPDWLRCPRTGAKAPLYFGKTLDYRDERLVGDIKYLWEPSRHQEMVTLAQAAWLTGEARFARGAMQLLQSWLQDNPYPLGPHWASSLELGIRLLSWSVAWQFLHAAPLHGSAAWWEDEAPQALRGAWLAGVFRHVHFVAGHLSRHSSANNHLLGELMGLIVAEATWPLWPELRRWGTMARRAFESEALRQNHPDGVNREQAFWYHHEVADMMLIVGQAAAARGGEFGTAYWQRWDAMLDFVAAVMDVGGHVPAVGDADDAVMLRLHHGKGFDVYRSLLASGALLRNRPDWAHCAAMLDDKTRCLVGAGACSRFPQLLAQDVPAKTPREFADGGYWVLGDRLGERDELRVVVDAGELGFLSLAAHGHADALAFTLSLAGRPMLVDPGTYAYHTQRKWRDHFRGTGAHNTVRLDGADQSQIGGNFLWTRHARATCELWQTGPEADRWVGSHDGYARGSRPVRHRRHLALDKRARRLQVQDELQGAGEHLVELHWQLAPEAQARLLDDGSVELRCGPAMLHLRTEGGRYQLHRGEDDPLRGWVSRAFDEKEPATVLRLALNRQLSCTLTTLIQVSVDPGPTGAADDGNGLFHAGAVL